MPEAAPRRDAPPAEPIIVIARLTAQEGKRDGVVEAFAGLVRASAEEPGTLMYVLQDDRDDPAVVWIYEVYADHAALDVHKRSDALPDAYARFGPLLARPVELFFGRPLAGFGLPGGPE